MGRYQVSVGKSYVKNIDKPKLYIEVNGLVSKSEAQDGLLEQVTGALGIPNVGEYVQLMAFDVTEPTARFIK